jgi:hypothetical protein
LLSIISVLWRALKDFEKFIIVLDNTQHVLATPSLVFERVQQMKGLANLVPGFNFISKHSQALAHV